MTEPPSEPVVSAERVERFVALLGLHQNRIQRFVLSLVPNLSDADDVLQNTNLFLWREFHRFAPGTDFVAWASSVAFHEVLAWRKKHGRDRLVFSDQFLTAVRDEVNASADHLEARAKALTRCVERLPVTQRELVRQRYTNGAGVEAIAASTGRTADAVYRMLSRVRQTLRECVGRSLAREGGA
jgi:RNA polymerase sigma-70 factor (ECF subfamily)